MSSFEEIPNLNFLYLVIEWPFLDCPLVFNIQKLDWTMSLARPVYHKTKNALFK
jgi:hypothetical protein